MGVFLNLYIQPHRIDAGAWKSMYQETLGVLEYCEFLDLYKPEGAKHVYARQSVHVEDLFHEGYGGWAVRGTMRTGVNIELYALYDSIEHYRSWTSRDPRERTIYQALLQKEDEGDVVNIFGNKTQGEDAHMYLLAIACLICHRFPDAAFVDGDISATQCQLAVEWINQFLKEPIDLPVNADAQRLLTAIKDSGVTDDQVLPCFFRHNLCGINAEVGQQVTEAVTAEQILQYYSNYLFYTPNDGKLCLHTRNMKEYLMLNLDFKLLCSMVLVDQQLPLTEFVKSIVGMKLHVKEKVTRNYGDMSRNSNEGLETIDTMMASLFVRLFGMENQNVNAYIPAEEIEAAISETLGRPICFSELEAAISEKEVDARRKNVQKELYEDPDSVFAFCQDETERCYQYDITAESELINYEPGMTVYPELEKTIIDVFQQIRAFAEECTNLVLEKDLSGRKDWFDNHYHVAITEEIEKELYSHLSDDAYISPYIGLYATQGAPTITHAARFNKAFLDHYWEVTTRPREEGPRSAMEETQDKLRRIVSEQLKR